MELPFHFLVHILHKQLGHRAAVTADGLFRAGRQLCVTDTEFQVCWVGRFPEKAEEMARWSLTLATPGQAAGSGRKENHMARGLVWQGRHLWS